MIKKTELFFVTSLLFFHFFSRTCNTQTTHRIGLCIMATGNYCNFAKHVISSAQKYFCTHHQVFYFIFTDGYVRETDGIKKIFQQRLGWPYDTLMRFEVYTHHKQLLTKMDYIFAIDADMLFVDYVGDEVLSDRVATLHPGYVGTRGTPETNSLSTACVGLHEGTAYFAGGFYGGTRDEFIRLTRICATHIQTDLRNNYIAVWHDESHLNRYFIDYPPTVILPATYCFPERYYSTENKTIKLLALEKNHGTMRG